MTTTRRILTVLTFSLLVVAAHGDQQKAVTPFASAVASLSERGGYFDTDNLISNESSYLQVLPELKRRGVSGGAYIGVGPDQNFTYIAATRPAVAYIVDIRRDNLLLHLLFKAVFQLARTRVEYLAILFGRTAPVRLDTWRDADAEKLARFVEGGAVADAHSMSERLETALRGFGVPLSADDLRTIAGFRQRFVDAGLSLRFQSAGRPPQWNYPTYGQMLIDRDSSGRQGHFLASEESYQFVRDLQARDLVIPVVGDLSGPSAVVKVGKAIAARGEKLNAFYVSNVEFYLFDQGTFARFVANLQGLPHGEHAAIIRSFFGRAGVPPSRPSDNSASQVQAVDDLLKGVAAGRIKSYYDLATR